MKEIAFAAYTNPGPNEPGLEATQYYDPPNMTYPNGAYVAVVSSGLRHRRGQGAPLRRRR